MTPCPRCRGLLRLDEDGIQVCRACSYPVSVPPVYPGSSWPNGVQPAPIAVKPRSGNREPVRRRGPDIVLSQKAPKPPTPMQAVYREQLRRVVVGGKADGKRHVAPRGGIAGI